MSLEFKVDELKEITYAAVTLRLKKYGKDGDDNEVSGLFIGMQPLVPNNTAIVSKDEMYIWLREGANCHMLSTKHYEVDNIFVGKDKAAWKFSGKPIDLDRGSSRLVMIHRAMKLADRVGPNGLIDASTYKELPDQVRKVIDSGDGIDNTETGAHHSRSGGVVHHPAACGYDEYGGIYGASTYKRKETTTKVFKRTTRYSPASAIERMWAKILEIQEGTYKTPKLKAFKEKEGKKKEKKAATSSATDAPDDDDDAHKWAWYGGMY